MVDQCSLASSCGEVKEKKRAQTLPSPLWKDRSGRLPETALSITSPRESFSVLPKRRTSSGLPALRAQPFSIMSSASVSITPSAIVFNYAEGVR